MTTFRFSGPRHTERTNRHKPALAVWMLAATGALCALLAGSAPAPAASPGATGKIAFDSSRDGNIEIYSMDADGANQTRLTTNTAWDSSPSWSPDGKKIAFHSNRDGNWEIYVMNADGTNQTRLTTNTANDFSPSWSPDGKKIAFHSNRDGNTEIYSMDANGANQTNLTNNAASDSGPSWSPDGKKIAFTSGRDGNAEIYVMDASGANQTRLTTNTANDYARSWSPDETKIAFESRRDGNFEVYVMDATGANQTRLTTNAADDYAPSWSPDGTKIAFQSSRDGNTEIYSMDTNGANQTNLTNNASIDEMPSWGPIPPDTTISAHPASSTGSSSAAFSFGSSKIGSSFECQLDAGAWSTCSSPKAYSGLAPGSHAFQVRAIDLAGVADPTPAGFSWTVTAVGKIASAKLSKKSFSAAQARKVKLTCTFSPKSKLFAYVLSIKKGKKWTVVRRASATGSFKTYKVTVKKLFGKSAIRDGRYRLKLSADTNSKLLGFRVT